MKYHILDATYVSEYTLRLRFRDGMEGEIDLAHILEGEVFTQLRDLAEFRKFSIHPEFHTLVWPNGADFDPATLHGWPQFEPAFLELARSWALVKA